MSLLFFDSFKNYLHLPLKWQERTANCSMYVKEGSFGRRGGNVLALECSYSEPEDDFIQQNLDDAYDELVIGFALVRVKDVTDQFTIYFCYNNDIQSRIVIMASGIYWYTDDIYNNYGFNQGFILNKWAYIEIKIKFSDTQGTLDIHINEVAILSLTSLNTITTTPHLVNNIKIGKNVSSLSSDDFAYIEDLYILNTLGTKNNTFLGNCTVSTLPVLTGGSSQQFLPEATYSGTSNASIITNTVYPINTQTYNSTYYEYSGADDGSYVRNGSGADWVFNNTSVMVPSVASIYMDTNTRSCYYWFRFSNINIPKNAKITNAYLLVNPTEIISEDDINEQLIFFEKSGTPVTQITSSADLLSRKFTYNKTKIPQQGNIANRDIKASLQELVDLPDWQQNNNSILAVIDLHYVDTNYSYIRVGYTAYEANNDSYHVNSPKLYIEWQLLEEAGSKYIYSSSLGSTDTYMLSVPSGITNILALSSDIIAKKDMGVDLYLTSTMVSGSNTTNSGSILPTTKYSMLSFIQDVTPDSLEDWKDTFITANEFGFTTISG